MTIDPLACAVCHREAQDGKHWCGGRHSRPSQESLQPFVDEYEAGATVRDMAARHGVDYSLMRRRLIWGGATMRPRGGKHR